jgi:hypothetical protein
MTISSIFVYDYERIHGTVDVCRSTCTHLHRFRDRILAWTVWRHECDLTGWKLDTFIDGSIPRAKRCDECKHLENTCERFDDIVNSPVPRATAAEEWAKIQETSNRNHLVTRDRELEQHFLERGKGHLLEHLRPRNTSQLRKVK